MKRSKRQKVKQENPLTAALNQPENEERDLAYYIHDRVELMHQVFSLLKPKDIKAMAPACVRKLSIDELKELCTDELLGISSKRLCAVLDDAEPPTDTESSSDSAEQLETISLDSISSDEEILSQSSSKKGKKHKQRRHSKRKEKGKSKEHHKSKGKEKDKSPSKPTKESTAGLTVLELLELQARARAIRAQLNKDKTLNKPSSPSPEAPQSSGDSSSSDGEIEIKEEPAQVVVISSDEEKPSPEALRQFLENMPASTSNCTVTRPEPSNTTTKRTNDLVITVPQAKTSRKIKLNRNRRISEVEKEKDKTDPKLDSNKTQKPDNVDKNKVAEATPTISNNKSGITSNSTSKKDKKKKDKKKTKKQKDNCEKEGSDHDEITLQLSDTEKMDLLDDLEGNKGKTSSSSEDSESSSDDSSDSSDNETLKCDKQESPTKSDAKIVSVETEKVPVKPSDKDSSAEEIPQISNQSQGNIFRAETSEPVITISSIEEIPTISNQSTDNDSKAGTTEPDITTNANEELPKSSNQSGDDNTVGSSIITTTNQDSTIKDTEGGKHKNDAETIIKDEKQSENTNADKADQIAIETEKKTGDIDDTGKVNSEIEEKPKVIPKEEIERALVEEIGSNIETQLSISTSLQEETPCIVRQTNEVEPMDVDEIMSDKSIEISNIKDLTLIETQVIDKSSKSVESTRNSPKTSHKIAEVGKAFKETLQIVVAGGSRSVKNKQIDASGNSQEDKRNKSDGELSDKDSSEIEAIDLQQEVVCISDDDKQDKSSKKKKKKDKKAKKEKKTKKSKSDFREDSDHNFYTDNKVAVNNSVSSKKSDNAISDTTISDVNTSSNLPSEEPTPIIIDEDDDVYEILELSDDSSCYEVEGVSILSKEPTAEEIQALSNKIDEINREEVVTEEPIKEHETLNKEESETNMEDIENISWKDRYLNSRKVKMVLSTSSIFNAMRKKNKELKKKIELTKKEAEQQILEETEKPIETPINLEEGSIEHFNTLTGSTKYVNPVQENIQNADNNTEEQVNKDVTNEMKKDAKQLLKMYKRLLKYNDINKQKDPNKKKKKKTKKNKNKSKDIASNSVAT